MKKRLIIPLLLCLALVLSACGMDAFDPDEYVGEGLLTLFGIEVDNNQYFYNEVFVLGHLKVDESKSVKKDGKTYAPVTDKRINTYDELKRLLSEIYTEDAVMDILENYDFYKDIDGKLYYDLSDKDNTRKGYKWERMKDVAPEIESREENTYVMEYKFACGKKDELDEFTFVRTENGYRLTKLQYVD